jgi:hypothetical protein
MKRFKYEVYTGAGVYITNWGDVISEPEFSMQVNGGLGELKVVLARNADDFGESDDVNFNNQIIVYCFDKDTNDGVKIFNGYISGYTPVLDGNAEYIEISVLGYVAELARVELLDDGNGIQETPTAGNTTLTYKNQKPCDILKDIIDKYKAITGSSQKVDYDLTSIADTGTTIDEYTFNSVFILDAINKIVEMSPANWYWYLDAENILHFQAFATTPDHTFFVKRDVISIKPNKRIENIKNACYVIGKETAGVNFFEFYKRDASIAAYGRNTVFLQDSNINTSDVSQKFADAQLDKQDEPEVRTQIVILDDNNEIGLGKDIESIIPGNVVNILNFLSKKTYTLWGQAVWNVNKWGFDISNVTATNINLIKADYKPDYISCEVSSQLPQVGRSLTELKRKLQETVAVNNPAVPT